MKITVLTGSPRVNSNSGYLAGEFVRGAESAGHSVFRFDAGRANIAPCRACNACRMDGPCVQRDDFGLCATICLNPRPYACARPCTTLASLPS